MHVINTDFELLSGGTKESGCVGAKPEESRE
jgi:hypothetical protein